MDPKDAGIMRVALQNVPEGRRSEVTRRIMASPKDDVEYSFVMFKPLALAKHMQEGMKRDLMKAVEGLQFEECKKIRVTSSLIEKHYHEHSSKPFFSSLVDYYDGKSVEACRVSGPRGTILKIRRKMGPSDPISCSVDQIRAQAKPYAETGETCGVDNLIHASDSPAAAVRELKIWGLEPENLRMAKPVIASKEVKAIANMAAWAEWVSMDKNTPEEVLENAAYGVGSTISFYAKQIFPDIVRFEIKPGSAKDVRVIWFLPDEANVFPVCIKAGMPMVWVAKNGGGSMGRLLGRTPKEAAEALTKVYEEP